MAGGGIGRLPCGVASACLLRMNSLYSFPQNNEGLEVGESGDNDYDLKIPGPLPENVCSGMRHRSVTAHACGINADIKPSIFTNPSCTNLASPSMFISIDDNRINFHTVQMPDSFIC